MAEAHHQPVLAEKVAELLVTNRTGTYCDLTAGGGGHLLELAKNLDSEAALYGTDWDAEAVARTSKRLAEVSQFRKIVRAPFAEIAKVADELGVTGFDGILLDLGISSYQLNDASRGIAFRHDGPLDMRLDQSHGTTASELVNSLAEPELRKIMKEYGEERQAKRIAGAIVRERQSGMITSTSQLREIVLGVAKPPHQNKTLARVFQALRIAVNQELEQLSRVLPAALSLLKSSGRMAVISYHSLEDRLVKRFFQAQARGVCSCPPELAQCVCGATPQLEIINRKPISPDRDEVEVNPRARSARLRVAQKV